MQSIQYCAAAGPVLPDSGLTAGARRRVLLAEAIAEGWRGAGISYAVVHGLSGYPAEIGRDLDMIIGRRDARPAAGIALAIARDHGFQSALFRWSHWGLYQLALLDRSSGTSLPIDMLCTTDVWRAKWVRLVDRSLADRLTRPDQHAGPIAASVEGHFLKACVRPLLCGDLRRFASEFPLPVAIPETIDRTRLRESIGEYGIALLGSASLGALAESFPAAMGQLQRDWIARHPLGALLSLFDSLKGRIKRRLFNAADVVLIETERPDELSRCLDDLVPELKRMFIDLRPVRADGGALASMWGAFYGWRQPPISEFVLYVPVRIVADDTGHADGRIERRAGRGRWALGADAVIRARGAIEYDTLRDELRAHLLDFMVARHTPPASLG